MGAEYDKRSAGEIFDTFFPCKFEGWIFVTESTWLRASDIKIVKVEWSGTIVDFPVIPRREDGKVDRDTTLSPDYQMAYKAAQESGALSDVIIGGIRVATRIPKDEALLLAHKIVEWLCLAVQ